MSGPDNHPWPQPIAQDKYNVQWYLRNSVVALLPTDSCTFEIPRLYPNLNDHATSLNHHKKLDPSRHPRLYQVCLNGEGVLLKQTRPTNKGLSKVLTEVLTISTVPKQFIEFPPLSSFRSFLFVVGCSFLQFLFCYLSLVVFLTDAKSIIILSASCGNKFSTVNPESLLIFFISTCILFRDSKIRKKTILKLVMGKAKLRYSDGSLRDPSGSFAHLRWPGIAGN